MNRSPFWYIQYLDSQRKKHDKSTGLRADDPNDTVKAKTLRAELEAAEHRARRHCNKVVFGASLSNRSSTTLKQLIRTDQRVKAAMEEEEEARIAGVNGVPFFVITGQLAFLSAQSPEHFVEAITNAAQAGEKCGPDSCSIH